MAEPMRHRIFVRNTGQLNEQELHAYFQKFGDVDITDVTLLRHKRTGQTRGQAFVAFSTGAEMERALENDEPVVNGQRVELAEAESKTETAQRKQEFLQLKRSAQEEVARENEGITMQVDPGPQNVQVDREKLAKDAMANPEFQIHFLQQAMKASIPVFKPFNPDGRVESQHGFHSRLDWKKNDPNSEWADGQKFANFSEIFDGQVVQQPQDPGKSTGKGGGGFRIKGNGKGKGKGFKGKGFDSKGKGKGKKDGGHQNMSWKPDKKIVPATMINGGNNVKNLLGDAYVDVDNEPEFVNLEENRKDVDDNTPVEIPEDEGSSQPQKEQEDKQKEDKKEPAGKQEETKKPAETGFLGSMLSKVVEVVTGATSPANSPVKRKLDEGNKKSAGSEKPAEQKKKAKSAEAIEVENLPDVLDVDDAQPTKKKQKK